MRQARIVLGLAQAPTWRAWSVSAVGGSCAGFRRPALSREVVLYTAHHDHLGRKDGAPGTDGIYNGALDNASGVGSMLAIAKAFEGNDFLPCGPKREKQTGTDGPAIE